ncbi:prolyl oligopeptidase family serine peptidase [Aequorivita viscosa]|nr:prolyl oligopeptidase family serine peptidase [Aequorivita viscosa]
MKELSTKDYGLWHNMIGFNLSDSGRWVSFHLSYDTQDTLVLQNTISKTKIFIAAARKEQFCKNDTVFTYLNEEGFTMMDLVANKRVHIPNVIDYKISNDSKYCALIKNTGNGDGTSSKTLELGELGKPAFTTVANVVEYQFNTKSEVVAYVTKKEAGYTVGTVAVASNNAEPIVLKHSEHPLKKLVWGTDRNLAFLEEIGDENNIVNWIADVVNEKQLHTFNALENKMNGKDFRILNTVSTTLHFSDDGEKLFFHFQNIEDDALRKDKNTNVQVWNTADAFTYPTLIGYGDYYNNPRIMAVWNLKNNTVFPLGTKASPNAVWGTNNKYVYTYGQFDDRVPSDDRGVDAPVYLYNTDDGQSDLVLKRKFRMPLKISPSGRFLNYFDGTDWWAFDAQTRKHTNLTAEIDVVFLQEDYDWSGVVPPYGNPGWTKDEEEILLYDSYDIWLVSRNGQKSQRLTQGREAKKTYRIDKSETGHLLFRQYTTSSFDLEKGVVAKIHHAETHGTGYAFLKKDKTGILPLVSSDGYLDHFHRAPQADIFIYTEENYNNPPLLEKMKYSNLKPVALHQSNPQHFNYKWGKAELVNYVLEDGTKMKGALFYPSNFKVSQTYPMLVSIYQQLSNKVNRYQNPSLLSGFELNITNFTTNGYFVFCPDIVYKINEPGLSALRCVTAGVEAVLKQGKVDRKRLGLFGHSFGGFETSFIIGQTDLFAAAVSGAGIQDLMGFYFSMAWLWQVPQSDRFLNDIMRFEKDYFEIPEKYKNNSPINFVENIHTPLLTITGDKDTNVNWEQSVQMFNALRILKKEHIMLIYPDEGHDFFEDASQIDFNKRIQDWYAHYLKEEPKKLWMIEQ